MRGHFLVNSNSTWNYLLHTFLSDLDAPFVAVYWFVFLQKLYIVVCFVPLYVCVFMFTLISTSFWFLALLGEKLVIVTCVEA